MKKQVGSISLVFLVLMIGLSGCATAPSTPAAVPTPTPASASTPAPISTATPTPASASTSAAIPSPTRTPAVSLGETYRNEAYAFAFTYPGDVTIEVAESPFQVRVSTEAANPFLIRATRDYLPGDAMYFLDTAPAGERTLGEHTWRTYELPDGYCDGPSCSAPIYALQMEAGQVLYTVVFDDQATTTPLQEQILSTFEILR